MKWDFGLSLRIGIVLWAFGLFVLSVRLEWVFGQIVFGLMAFVPVGVALRRIMPPFQLGYGPPRAPRRHQRPPYRPPRKDDR